MDDFKFIYVATLLFVFGIGFAPLAVDLIIEKANYQSVQSKTDKRFSRVGQGNSKAQKGEGEDLSC